MASAERRRCRSRPTATEATVTGIGAAGGAEECKPLERRVAFEDKFKSADPGWGVAANTPASFADGELVLKPTANKTWN